MIILLILKLLIFFLIINLDLDYLKFLPIILPVILSIAFLTLYERKVLGAINVDVVLML